MTATVVVPDQREEAQPPAPVSPPRRPRAVAEVVLATLAPAVTAVVYKDFFFGTRYLPVLLGAAAGGTAVAALAAWRRWNDWFTALAGVVGFAVLAVFAVFTPTLHHGLPSLGTFSQLGTGLLHGWARMLTTGLPADVAPTLLVTPVLVMWTATFSATLLVLRTRAALGPLVPAVLALAVTLLLTGAHAAGGVIVAGALLLILLLLALVRVSRLDSATAVGRISRFLFGLPVIVAVAAVAAAGAYTVPVSTGANRFDPRTVVPIPLNIDDGLTPLVTLKSQLRQQPPQTLFTVRFQPGASALKIDRIRTAALDQFDGALWTSDDTYLVSGHSLAGNPTVAHPSRTTVHVDIAALAGPYLPTVGWPVGVDRSGLGFSHDSGILVTDATTLTGLAYDETAELRPDDGQLAAATPDYSDRTGRYTDLPPGLPPDIRTRVTELTAPQSQPYAKLKAIEAYLHGLPYSLDARPGHSYDALKRLFGTNPLDRVGYAEQYASAFAILARSQGFPTRVATGYLLRPAERAGDTYTVTTADAHAWAEVDLAGYGWVQFEPTNFTNPKPTPQTQQETANTPDRPAQNDNPGSGVRVDPNLPGGESLGRRLATGGLVTLAVVAALLLLVPLLTTAEKMRRRQRRRRGGPAARVVGAWWETVDRLVENGVPVSRSSTALEVAADARKLHGEAAAAVAVLAPIVTSAVSSPDLPTDEEVREAWRLHKQVNRDLRRQRGRLRGLRGRFDPRPLFAGWRDSRHRGRLMAQLRGGRRR